MLQYLPNIVAYVQGEDATEQRKATIMIRKMLTKDPPIEEIIQTGVVPLFVKFLTRKENPELQIEAAWALRNIASAASKYTKVVIDQGAVPNFVELLSSPRDDVREEAAWALGTISSDSPECRDLVLNSGGLIPLLPMLNEHAKPSSLKSATWTLLSFFRGEPEPPLDKVMPAFPALQRLANSNEWTVSLGAVLALSMLSSGTNNKSEAGLEDSICSEIIELLHQPSPSVPTLHSIAKNVSVNDMHAQLENLPNMVAEIRGRNHTKQLNSTIQIRRMLGSENPPIEEIIQTDVVRQFVEFLMRKKNPELQIEAALALGKIVSGGSKYTKVVIEHGAVPNIVKLLSSPRDDVRVEAAFAMGTICMDSAQSRDLVLSTGGLISLLPMLNEHANPSSLETATWTLYSFFTCRPDPPVDEIKPAFPILQRLMNSDDDAVSSKACIVLATLSGGTVAGVCPKLVQILHHPEPSTQYAALTLIAQILSVEDRQAQVIIQHRALPRLRTFLTNNNENNENIIKQPVCWIIRYIAAGSKDQIQAVVEANLIGPLVALSSSGDFYLKKLAATALSNVVSGGSEDHIKHIANEGCIKLFCDIDLLTCAEKETVVLSLIALGRILEAGENRETEKTKINGRRGGVNPYVKAVDDAGEFEKLYDLLDHDDMDVFDKALHLIEIYWLNPWKPNYRP